MNLTELTWLPQAPNWALNWPLIEADCPWLADLAHTAQDPEYHAEGNVLIHTRMVAEALVALAEWRALPPMERAALLLAALLHDIGKPATTTTDAQRHIIAPGHARIGAAMTREMLWVQAPPNRTLPFAERELTALLVRLHGLPLWFFERPDFERAIRAASVRIRLDLVALLAEADVRGRICKDSNELLAQVDVFREWCREQHCLAQPYPFPDEHSRVCYCRGRHQEATYRAYDSSWGEVSILAGAPGVGKDTWVRSHAADLPVIALDAIRAERGIDADEPQGAVVRAAWEQAREYLRRKQAFIWNATNLTRRLRDPLADLLLDYGARVRIVYLDAPFATILQHNRQRPEPVPEMIIRRLAARAEPPDLSEAHTLLVQEIR
jgi:putative nucleotidyltransferase with HDIG domain